MQSDPESNQPDLGLSHSDILNIVLIYAVFGTLWILLSDTIVEWLFTDAAQMTLFSMLKGWLYVGFTSLLLYSLMHRWMGRESSSIDRPARSRRVVLTFAVLAVIIVSLTIVAIIDIHLHHRETALARLQTVADMKSQQISDWLRERQADADFVQSSRYLTEQYQRWQGSGDLESAEHFKSRLAQFCKDWRFTAITLLGPAGEKLWSSGKTPHISVASIQNLAQRALVDNKAWRIAAYRDTANIAHLDFVAPLSVIPKSPPLVILHIDLANWLFPTLKLWPIPNKNGEILLFRFDKDKVIYLNELRQSENSFAKLSIPGLAERLITTPIQTGKVLPNTLMEGLDYLGIPVIAVVKAVPGTDWFLVSKMNRSDFYAATIKDAIWIGFVGLLSLFITTAGFHLVRQQQQLALAQAVQYAQSERLNALNLLANIAECSSDAIFAKDLEGRYMLFNQAACEFVGMSENEVLNHDDRSLFPSEQAEILMAIGRQVIDDNTIQTREEVLSTAKGERVFLATKGPLHNSEGAIIGIFGISRDITDMKRIEKSLYQSEERLRFALDAGRDGLFDFDLSRGLAYLSPRYFEMTGYRPEEVVSDFDFFKRQIHPDDLTDVLKIVEAHIQGKTPTADFEYRLLNAYGQHTWVRVRARIVERNKNREALRIVGTMTDITASKVTEQSLLKQSGELAQRNEELERFNRATVGRELDMIALKKEVNALSLKLGLEPPYDLTFLELASPPQSFERDQI